MICSIEDRRVGTVGEDGNSKETAGPRPSDVAMPVKRLFIGMDVDNMDSSTRRAAGPAARVPFKILLDGVVTELHPAARAARAYMPPNSPSWLEHSIARSGFLPRKGFGKGSDDVLLTGDLVGIRIGRERPDMVVNFSSDGDFVPAYRRLVRDGVKVRVVGIVGSVHRGIVDMAERGLIDLVYWDASTEAWIDERWLGIGG